MLTEKNNGRLLCHPQGIQHFLFNRCLLRSALHIEHEAIARPDDPCHDKKHASERAHPRTAVMTPE